MFHFVNSLSLRHGPTSLFERDCLSILYGAEKSRRTAQLETGTPSWTWRASTTLNANRKWIYIVTQTFVRLAVLGPERIVGYQKARCRFLPMLNRDIMPTVTSLTRALTWEELRSRDLSVSVPAFGLLLSGLSTFHACMFLELKFSEAARGRNSRNGQLSKNALCKLVAQKANLPISMTTRAQDEKSFVTLT